LPRRLFNVSRIDVTWFREKIVKRKSIFFQEIHIELTKTSQLWILREHAKKSSEKTFLIFINIQNVNFAIFFFKAQKNNLNIFCFAIMSRIIFKKKYVS